MSQDQVFTIDADADVPGFTAAYLRVSGSECAFVEAYTSHALPRLLDALARAGRKPEDVRYVVVTHAHLDHAGGAGVLVRACPNATLLAHPRAARHLVDPSKLVKSATSVYGEERFQKLYGTIESIAAERVRALEDGETFDLGSAKLTVLHTAGHANHHFAVHDPALDTVYTGDTFGLVYPALQTHGRFALASTSPTNFDAVEARKSVDRVLSLGTKTVRPTHFGEVDRPSEVAAQLRRWIDLAERWVDEAAAGDESVETMTARLAGLWKDAIVKDAETRKLGFGERELAALALDIDLNAQGLAFVADARRRAAAKS